MANMPKFVPAETPIENYQQNAVAWSYCQMKYRDPKGPKVSQYDPYYMYTVIVNLNGQNVDHVWFVNVDEHVKIQMTGATSGTLMAATYVKEGKRKGLVVVHSTGPAVIRDEAVVWTHVNGAVAALQNQGEGGVGSVPLPPEQPTYAPPTAPPDPFAPAGAIDNGPPPPQAPQAPVPPPATPTPPVSHPQAVVAPSASQAPPPVPPKPPTPPASATPKPPAPAVKPSNNREYMPLSSDDEEVFKIVWRETARLHLWAFHELVTINTEMEFPKITAANVRELATSVTIESWRQLGRGRSPLTGMTLGTPPVTAKTRAGALELIGALTLNMYDEADDLIRQWLKWVAEPVDSIGAWQHAGNICDLFGLDRTALIDDFNVDVLLQMTQAVWYYSDKRTTEDLPRNDVLFLVSHEYDIPQESMKFEEDEQAA